MGKFKLKRKTFGWKGWTAAAGAGALLAGATMNVKDKANIITGDVNSNSGKGLGTGYVLGGLGAGALAVAGLAKGGAGLVKGGVKAGKGIKKAWNWATGAKNAAANATKTTEAVTKAAT